MQIRLGSVTPKQTEEIGNKIGQHLKGSEVIEVKSDLGGGKTTFVRGLVKGAGSTDKVASPSFTISKVYKTNKFSINHFDFYRLNDAGLMKYEIPDLFKDPKAVIVIEWSDIVRSLLPEDRLSIGIKTTDVDKRQVIIDYPKSLTYLVEGLC